MLPLPGAAIVRLTALKSGGAPLRSGLSATALLAALSIGLGFSYAGAWAMLLSDSAAAVVTLALGILVVFAAWFVAREIFGKAPIVLALIAVRVALVALDATRTWLAFAAIGYGASFGQSSVLTIATVLSAIVTVVPAGLGLREGLAAFIAPLVGLGSAPAFLATSLSRIVGLSVVLSLTLVLALRRKAAESL